MVKKQMKKEKNGEKGGGLPYFFMGVFTALGVILFALGNVVVMNVLFG